MNRYQELLAGCEAEQLHRSGAIQGWGTLLWIDAANGLITHAAANIRDYLALDPAQCCGQPASSLPWLGAELAALPAENGASRQTTLPDGIEARLLRAEHGVAVELEREEPVVDDLDLHALQQGMLRIPASEADLQAYGNALVAGIARLSGFHRVMLYRFHDDWSGEVIAEQTTPELGSYLGLRFPASDIPAIARRLYLINDWRLIADTRAAAVALQGRTRAADDVDLSRSDLRSVSPVHLQYLANMGVHASFSLPVRVAGQLWGLVACHHLQAKYIGARRRRACAALSSAYALGLSSFIAARRMQSIDRLDRRVDSILERIASHDNPLDGIDSCGETLRQAIDAEGFAMAIGDEVALFGNTPALDQMAQIDRWFLSRPEEPLYATDHLGSIFPNQPVLLSVASGMMAIKANSARSGLIRFYWFRPEEPTQIIWAGNPNKPEPEDAGAVMLSPRRSFEKWVEVRSAHSRPWSNEERMVAAKFRNYLLRWL